LLDKLLAHYLYWLVVILQHQKSGDVTLV